MAIVSTRNLAVAVFLVSGLCGLAYAAQRSDITASQRIQGFDCASGPVWHFDGGKLNSCKLAHDTRIGDYTVPADSWIRLRADGTVEFVMLAHAARIGGVICRGNGPEGFSTALHPNGKLKECWPEGDQIVQGVPCRGANFLSSMSSRTSVKFFDSGRFRGCVLSADYKTFKQGDGLLMPD